MMSPKLNLEDRGGSSQAKFRQTPLQIIHDLGNFLRIWSVYSMYRAILSEYSGAVLGVLSAVLYGRRGHLWKKVGGLVAMSASFYFLSQGLATATHFPFTFTDSPDTVGREQVLGMKEMLVPIAAGVLSALRRVIARRVSLKNRIKRRLHAITITSATCFLFPHVGHDSRIHRNRVAIFCLGISQHHLLWNYVDILH